MANDNHQTLVILKQIKRFSPCDGIFNILPKGTVSQEQYVEGIAFGLNNSTGKWTGLTFCDPPSKSYNFSKWRPRQTLPLTTFKN